MSFSFFSDISTLDDGTDMYSRNVCFKLPTPRNDPEDGRIKLIEFYDKVYFNVKLFLSCTAVATGNIQKFYIFSTKRVYMFFMLLKTVCIPLLKVS
jgi:hypothetical protein